MLLPVHIKFVTIIYFCSNKKAWVLFPGKEESTVGSMDILTI